MDDITRKYEAMLYQRSIRTSGEAVGLQEPQSEVQTLSSMITDYHAAFRERVRVSDVVDDLQG